MNNQNFINHIKNLLKNNKQYLDNEGYLLVDEVRRLASRYDETLLNTLYSDEKARKTFFQEVGKATIFKLNDFDFFLEEKLIDNSYTAYENRIGLATGKKMLKDMSDVVLNFPYKDCILEGGQSTEEGLDTYFEYSDKVGEYEEKQAKRKEIFFNQVLAKDEIDRLTEPKAFENIKRYTKEGEEEFTSFNRNGEGTITDNLIIKGNNLLALHSLLPEFKGKIKLIYIDPPYNTENDSFVYNDNFNHSSWLTFMRNRLEIALLLLKEEGVIFVSLDDKESHYCKVLMDSIFKRENFIADICHKSRASISNDKIISPDHNHILLYAKNERKVFSLKEKFGIRKNLDGFKLKDKKGFYKLVPVDGPGGAAKGNPFYDFLGIEGYWRFSKERMQKMYDDGLIVKTQSGLQQKYYKHKAAQSKQTVTTWWDENFLTSSATSDLKKLMGDKVFNNPKNVNLLKRIIELWCDNDDIILDYHAGSGTTAHAVLELNSLDKQKRQFILCEQMDYAKSLTAERIKLVIKKENSDNSFIYMDLAKNNQKAIDYIENCQSYDELVAFFDEMCDTYFLDYNLKIKEFREQVSKEENFKQLSLNKQKEVFAKMLDLNQLYVNVSDMEDSKFKMNEKDIRLTNDFYKK